MVLVLDALRNAGTEIYRQTEDLDVEPHTQYKYKSIYTVR